MSKKKKAIEWSYYFLSNGKEYRLVKSRDGQLPQILMDWTSILIIKAINRCAPRLQGRWIVMGKKKQPKHLYLISELLTACKAKLIFNKANGVNDATVWSNQS